MITTHLFQALAAAVDGAGLVLPAMAQQQKPNVVFILVDNVGWGSFGVYGGTVPTPRIDKLAAEGIRFNNYNVEVQCTPSRAAILTGRHPVRSGTYTVPFPGQGEAGLSPWEYTLAKLLSDAGYATALYGKWHLGETQGRLPNDQGFDEWWGIMNSWDEAGYTAWPLFKESGVPEPMIWEGKKGQPSKPVMPLDLKVRPIVDEQYIIPKTIDYIKRNAAAKKPFFVYVGYSEMHPPIIANPNNRRASADEPVRSWLGRKATSTLSPRVAETFSDEQIVSALRRQLSWTHIKTLMYLDDATKRDFYIELCRLENWSSRQLQERIGSMLYERSAISRKPETTIHHDIATLRRTRRPSADLLLKDPYILDFLGLNDRYLERDLEDAILREIEKFLLELGAGFTFVAKQKRIQIDQDDFYIDLLFYNRKLKRLVAVDLKVGEFRVEYKGQMELYLRWLAKHETEADEDPPLGIILCAGKKQEQVELLQLDKSGIHVAEFLTVLPPREVLQAKLHQSIAAARQRLLDGNL